MARRNQKLKFTLIPLLALGLLTGTAFLGQRIMNRINQDIYNQPRGEVTGGTPGKYGLDYNEVEFKTGNDILLKGWYVPAGSKVAEASVILAPGKAENRWDMLKYVPFISGAGFNVLLFDPRSTGLSGGKKYGFGYFESRDIINAARFLHEQKGETDVAVLGRSAGATAALLAASDSSLIDAVVADSPYANLKLASKDFGSYSGDITLQLFFPIFMFSAKLVLGFDLYRETNILKSIDGVETPVFFIHGLEDEGVGYQNSESFSTEKTNQNSCGSLKERVTFKHSPTRKADTKRRWLVFLKNGFDQHRQF